MMTRDRHEANRTVHKNNKQNTFSICHWPSHFSFIANVACDLLIIKKILTKKPVTHNEALGKLDKL